MPAATNMADGDQNSQPIASMDLERTDDSSTARFCPLSHHHGSQPENPGVCMEVIDVLEGFFALEKRSETLNGSVPLRAAQGCKPLLEGNAAGFQLRMTEPAVIRVGRGGPTLALTDEGYTRVTATYASRIAHVLERGLLVKGGYWHRELSKGLAWKKNTTLSLWTGLLARPAPCVWLLVSGAFNRHCLVNLAEYVITDDEAFVPVILQLDLSSLRARDTWLDTELACLTPLRPDVSFTMCSLRQQPEVGRAFCDFYDASYLAPRAEGKYLGRYRKITAREPVTAGNGKAECQLVIFGGPNVHRIGTFDRFATASGRTRSLPAKRRFQFGVVRNICNVKGRWDGSSIRDISADMIEEAQRLRNHWAELYGPEKIPSIDWLTEYAHCIHGPQRGEPYLPITPWLFAVTPPGWSSIIDSRHFDGLDGMRGVISTDTYFGVPPQWQVTRPGRFAITRGAPLARVLPVPRRLLWATFRRLALDGEVLHES